MKLPRTSPIIALLMVVGQLTVSCAVVPSPAPPPDKTPDIPGGVVADHGLPPGYVSPVAPAETCYTYADVFDDHALWCTRGDKVLKVEHGDAVARDPTAAHIDVHGFWQVALSILLFGDGDGY